MSKLGILGGTFDPIHNGHMYMAEKAFTMLGLDRVIFIPSGRVPHKNNKYITESIHRYNMVCCAVDKFENYSVSDMEISRDGVCYTFETLKELCGQYKGDELHFIVGADSIFAIDSWKNPEEIFKYAAVAVIGRPTDACFNIGEFCRKTEEKYNGIVELLPVEGPDISSTKIRQVLKNGGIIEGFVPFSVLQYIKKHRLYER